MQAVQQFLVQSQNSDGGWGYRLRGMSFVEPTAAVLLALGNSTETSNTRRARDLLLSLQHADGGWGIARIDLESGWMTCWAVIALAQFPEASEAVARGVEHLIHEDNLRVTDPNLRQGVRQIFQIDSTLRGWPWQAGDAAWVHPTSLAILALVQARNKLPPEKIQSMLAEIESRVRDGIAYLFDRAVSSGGWNIGNPWMIDKAIPATIQDTAVALRAIRAADAADKSRVAKAILFLRDALNHANTPAELAWGIYALRDWGEDSKDWVARLNALQSADASWNGNPFITAIAMLAQ